MTLSTLLSAVLLLLTLLPATISAQETDLSAEAQRRGLQGAVYTMTNASEGNSVLVFGRFAGGRLSLPFAYPTGGLGTGSGLGNQGAIALDQGNRWLFVVNAGSNSISAFRITFNGLQLVSIVDSGGERPVSLTVHRRLLYVLNAGGSAGDSDNITGFFIGPFGKLFPLPDSTRPLSAPSTNPAQIGFSPDGDVLVVTEKGTNKVSTYTVGNDGLPMGPIVYDSPGMTPFGFAFGKRNQLFVSEAFGGAPDASTVSSYEVTPSGDLVVINPSVPTTETAACWLVVTRNGRYAYTTNTGSGSVTGFQIGFNGALTLLDPDGRTGDTGEGSAPIDMALTNNSRFLYVLNSGTHLLSAFWVRPDGSLVPLPGTIQLPETANGMAAR